VKMVQVPVKWGMCHYAQRYASFGLHPFQFSSCLALKQLSKVCVDYNNEKEWMASEILKSIGFTIRCFTLLKKESLPKVVILTPFLMSDVNLRLYIYTSLQFSSLY
jgi:hypothetical protein